MRTSRLSRNRLLHLLVFAVMALFLSVLHSFPAVAAPAKVKQVHGKPKHMAQHSRHTVKKAKPGAAKKSMAKKNKARSAAKSLKQKKRIKPAQKAVTRAPRLTAAPENKPAMAPIATPVASAPEPAVKMACSINGKVYLMRDCSDTTSHIADTTAR